MSSSQQNLVNDMALSHTRMNFYYLEFIREVGVFRTLAMRMRHYYPIRDSGTNNGMNRAIQDVINLSSIDTNLVGNRLSVFNTIVSKLTRDIGK